MADTVEPQLQAELGRCHILTSLPSSSPVGPEVQSCASGLLSWGGADEHGVQGSVALPVTSSSPESQRSRACPQTCPCWNFQKNIKEPSG